MIRDPSDGSVKENGIVGKSHNSKPVIESTTSGLPIASDRAANIAKLEKSREWLKQYRTRKDSPITGQVSAADTNGNGPHLNSKAEKV